jgi:predicted NUDIX family NTP pyrophosphohydrolase
MKTSAGLLMYRCDSDTGQVSVLLAHPGGPFFRNKDDGAWTLPKGELDADEQALACALREFREETGIDPSGAELLSLGEIRQKGGKKVSAWAFAAPAHELDLGALPASNTFELEWPPRSGKKQSFPEIDKIAMFTLGEARGKILAAQAPFLERLEGALRAAGR